MYTHNQWSCLFDTPIAENVAQKDQLQSSFGDFSLANQFFNYRRIDL